MFSLFNKKNESIKVKDIIWMNSDAKWNGLIDLWKKDKNTVFIFWFDKTLQQAQKKFSDQITGSIDLVTSKEVHHHLVKDKPVVAAEHYPLRKKKEELFQALHLEEVKVLSSLDEPLFKKFGSDNIIQLMKQVGMKENESLEHAMITKAIQNAQEKIKGQVKFEQSAHSQSDWLKKNLPA
ncbi:MAG: hypothetical protein ACHQF0_05850 [Chitinophagales bacterium]